MIRSRDVINRMKGIEEGVQVFRDCLAPETIGELKSWYDNLRSDESNNIPRASNPKTGRRNFITPIKREEYHRFNDSVCKHIGMRDYLIDSVQFYNIQNPYHMHSDTGKNNKIAYKQGVVPLEVNPHGVDTYTVIFDQRVYFSSEYIHPAYKKNPGYEPFYNIGTWDPSIYEGWSDDYKIPDDLGRMLWYDEWPFWKEVYKGFSIKNVFKWKVGDVLLFDRSLLHAASLLDKAGITNKVGLLFLTDYQEGAKGLEV